MASGDHTEAKVVDPPADVTPIPAEFYWALWVPVFAVVTYGMMKLFGRVGSVTAENIPHPGDDSSV
jgi:hypothetical protein